MNRGRSELKSSFYLVNKSKKWLIKNFEFIQAFFAGAEWLHMKYCMVRPPNVYHVLCPGRFQIYWAALDIEITFEGKLRKHVEASNYFKNKGIKSIDEDMLWPEAWKVDVTIKDLTPNNFNLYAEYYQYGFKADEIKSLEQNIGISDSFNKLKEHLTELYTDIKTGVGEGLKEGYKAITGKDYDQNQELSATMKSLEDAANTKFVEPIKKSIGFDSNEDSKIKALEEDIKDLEKEYSYKVEGRTMINREGMEDDPRYRERKNALEKAKADAKAKADTKAKAQNNS
jgi:hypothetical protein